MAILHGKRIFIVEDNPANMAVTKLLLERHGAVVWFDRRGTEAMERLAQFAPVDLIMLDLMFPGNMSGYDLFDQIRAQPEYANVPIVAVSASNPSEAIPKVRARGFSGYIAKPIDYDTFALTLEKLLDGEKVWVG